jgi:hypothetical protein
MNNAAWDARDPAARTFPAAAAAPEMRCTLVRLNAKE